jgi:hypothetical protein
LLNYVIDINFLNVIGWSIQNSRNCFVTRMDGCGPMGQSKEFYKDKFKRKSNHSPEGRSTEIESLYVKFCEMHMLHRRTNSSMSNDLKIFVINITTAKNKISIALQVTSN